MEEVEYKLPYSIVVKKDPEMEFPNLRLQVIAFKNGERYPLLVDSTGLPLWHPTLYATTQLRNASKAPNTMVAVLAAIRSLLSWAASIGMDLERRLAQRHFLNDQEIESLRSYSESPWSSKPPPEKCRKLSLPNGIERARGAAVEALPRVAAGTHYIRMTYAADYLEWLSKRLIEREARQLNGETLVAITQMTKAIKLRRPVKSSRPLLAARRGLDEKAQAVLLDVIVPNSPRNPFEVAVRARNQIIVRLLLDLGTRAGELLALKVSDFDFLTNTVIVARRHDDLEDPRVNQPVAKTLDRRIPLSNSLASLVRAYVMSDRHMAARARQHPFLLVVHQHGPLLGAPLNAQGLGKMFRTLRSVAPEILAGLSPHTLRYTANDRLSARMDEDGTSIAEEEQLRSYIMGWRQGSGTAATYTRRHIERKAQELMLNLQQSKANRKRRDGNA